MVKEVIQINGGEQITEDIDVSSELFNALLGDLQTLEVQYGVLESKT